jgi:hypothetical protein
VNQTVPLDLFVLLEELRRKPLVPALEQVSDHKTRPHLDADCRSRRDFEELYQHVFACEGLAVAEAKEQQRYRAAVGESQKGYHVTCLAVASLIYRYQQGFKLFGQKQWKLEYELLQHLQNSGIAGRLLTGQASKY